MSYFILLLLCGVFIKVDPTFKSICDQGWRDVPWHLDRPHPIWPNVFLYHVILL